GGMEEGANMRRHIRTEIGFDILDLVAEGAEHHAAKILDADTRKSVLRDVEILRHAAFAGEAALEGDRGQRAFQIVSPGVIDAGELLAVAMRLDAQHRALMGTAIDEGIDVSVLIAADDDRHLAG